MCNDRPEDYMTPQHCPNCPDQGWYVVPGFYTGEPEQEQCEFCWTVKESVFNLNKLKP